MNRMSKRSRTRNSRGSMLIYAVILLTAAGVEVMGVTRLVRMDLDQEHESEARLQALYAAESGIQQTTDWFNRGHYTGDVSSNRTTTQVSSTNTAESAPTTLLSASSLRASNNPSPSSTYSPLAQSNNAQSSMATPQSASSAPVASSSTP